MTGQYWKLINLDKRETYSGFRGSLGKCLFDGSPRCLDQTLRIPPPLPDCDMLLFPFKPGALCAEADELRGGAATYFPQTAVQLSALVNLHVELIQEIHYDLEDIRDIICLSVTCQALWEVGRREIYRRVALLIKAFSWAGDRIMCVGEYLQNDDIPSHILTAAETDEFTRLEPTFQPTRLELDLEPWYDDWGIDVPPEHYNLYSYPFSGIPLRGHGKFNMHEFLNRSNLPFYFHGRLRALVDLDFAISQSTKSAMGILRNLSRHQYVRESTLSRWQGRSKKDGFGEIVLSRICWSSDPFASMTYKGDIHRGVWAGDRFDIVPSEWLEGLDNDGGLWTDVSEEVLAEISLIWASGSTSDI
ncbi:hypothetical protein C8R45DRAFT_249483 [Mycena sanguinolenta]|nr:hypothetical protein C8R45DRAFT_249483 [Mycena sanguinolenta]